MLLIQKLFSLSDEQTEFQLLDRLSFQRFVDLRQSSQMPDRCHHLDLQGTPDRSRCQRDLVTGGKANVRRMTPMQRTSLPPIGAKAPNTCSTQARGVGGASFV
ncbi:transposase [Duganella levis]|uniref:transposase n=1 Tax=Duganella levis TaxID=2692169 RepID=UPI0035311673